MKKTDCSRSSLVAEQRPLGTFWRCRNCRSVFSTRCHLTAYEHLCGNTTEDAEHQRCFVCGLVWKREEVSGAPESPAT